MKRTILFLSLALAPILASAQTDSTKSVMLSEVEIQADARIETATHSTLIPKAEDVKHSANAFGLLEVMHVAGLNVDAQKKALTTALGQEVVLCIDGVEVSATEWETLRSKNVRKIELVHNPDGKYSGKGAVVNIVTKQQKYGGNVYLSARESFIFNSGEYIASADCNWGRNRLSVTYSNDWQRSRNEHLASDLTPYTALDIREPFHTKTRIDASLHTSYNYKDWRLEIRANNLLNKFDKMRNWMNYSCFDMSHTDLDQSRGRSIVLKLVCNFGYGKKTEKEETTVDKMMKSAILRGK